MQIDRTQAEGIAREAMAALQRGDGKAARERFATLVDAGHDAAPMCLMLARACRASGDGAGEARALDRALERDQNNLQALLMRGDCSDWSGDARAAGSFYQRALEIARTGGAPPELAGALQQAQQFLQARAAEFGRALKAAVGPIEPDEPAAATRLKHSLEMLEGKREIFLQQPSVHYYPYLAQRQFFEREEFEWAAGLEAEAGAIREELLALLEADADFQPYVQPEKDRPPRDFHDLVNNPSWTALYLWKDGERVGENARRCPRTMAALDKVPLSRIGSRTPSVLFSRLLPGAHIPPHHGMLNSRLICHLPLIVPEGCWLRVGSETRQWEEGKLLVFDDSIEHEAKNPSDEVRIILLFDIWRPELTDAERAAISAIFQAIDSFQGVPADR